MGWNPCCCWKLKDAAITIGIWSALFAVVELGIYGWQMAAIKYERDRAANTLLPNYNTYGRYDIPSYYESYWQSPEERYYTGLFVIQVLCLIANFFLLFASVALIYGVHAWSRFLVWPWIPVMIASILTSTAYCVMWWAGDVRDYWLVLTILEIFGVFINVYLTLVICVFYSRMNRVLEHYEGKRNGTKNYNRFSPNVTSQEIDVSNAIDEGEIGYRNQWDDPDRWYPDPKYPPPPPDPYFDSQPPYPPYGTPLKRPLDDPPFDPPPNNNTQLSHAQSVPSLFDDSFRDVPRGHHHRRSHRHKSCHCHHRSRRHSHGHRRSRSRCKNKNCDCSDSSSIGPSESTDSRCHHRHRHRRDYSDDESDTTCNKHHRHRSERRGPRQVKRDDREQKELKHISTQADPLEPIIGSPAQGFTIPQNIVIPPVDAGLDADGNVQPRKYQINSEITISYDPKQQQLGISPRPETRNSGYRSSALPRTNAPVSITSNV